MADFGHDLWLDDDLDMSMREVDGFLCLGQALKRRLQTPRGGLIDDPNYGTDVTGRLNDDVTPRELAQMGSEIDPEFVKDERVLRSTTTVAYALGVATISSIILTNDGPFRLVL